MPRYTVARHGRRLWNDVAVWTLAAAIPWIPLIVPWSWLGAAILGLGLVVTLGLVRAAWDATDADQWSRHTRIKLPTVLVALVAAEIGWFASAYWVAEHLHHHAFTEHLSRLDSAYVSIGTYSTAGTGVISPLTTAARLLTSIEQVVALATVVVLLAASVSAAVTKRNDDASAPPPS